ncbi:MAG: hypothetical protein GKC10_09730, partial [Methanosarcinales archaeon]|nr:hypothetical protein [Methanosarcinales archaeon]
MILLLFIILLLSFSASGLEEPAPRGAVVLIVDGLGSSYVYPEHRAYTLDGRGLEGTTLYNLTGDGARVQDIRAPAPVTGEGHSVLVTGFSRADEQTVGLPGATIFDLARSGGYLCLAILQRGDSMEMLLEQDGVLYFDDNSIPGQGPVLGSRSGLPEDVRSLLQEYRDAFSNYQSPDRSTACAEYDRWGLEAAADLVRHLDRPFLLLVNVGAVDSGGHQGGWDDYHKIVAALDRPLGNLRAACQEKDVLLVVTADHGMAFSGGRGGHATGRYPERLESRRIPASFSGPGVDDLILGGVWSQADVAPTVLGLLGLPANLTLADGVAMPLADRCQLLVRLASPGEVEVLFDGAEVARSAGSREHSFRLERGLYQVRAMEQTDRIYPVSLSRDTVLDLRPEAPAALDLRRPLGWLLILAINLTGMALIIRIWKGPFR